jgi:predicted DNA-binding transcriptional regulator YafY
MKSRSLILPPRTEAQQEHFASVRAGTIDLVPHQHTIRTLMEGMEKRRVCRVRYRAVLAERAKTLYIKPLKLFTYADSLYLHARLARAPGNPYREPDFDPILAVHRIREIELTETLFEPGPDSFDKSFNKTFGLIKGEPFTLEVEFRSWAAEYAAERIWSQDQQIVHCAPDRVRLRFSSASEPEVLRFVLSFGDCAKVLSPDWLVERVREAVRSTEAVYDE